MTGSIWYQGHPLTETSSHRGWSGPGVEGCKTLGIHIFSPAAWLPAERAWIGERSSEVESFLPCPCVSRRRSLTSAVSLEAQSSLAIQGKEPGCELRLCYLGFTLLLGWLSEGGQNLRGRCPSCKDWLPFLFASKKVKWITGRRKKERRGRRMQLPT